MYAIRSYYAHVRGQPQRLEQGHQVDGAALERRAALEREHHRRDAADSEQASKHVRVITSYSIHYTKLYEKGLTNMVVAYSPDRFFSNEEEYLTWYPGDDVIDIVGMDNYHDLKCDSGVNEVIKKLHVVIQVAKIV